MRPCNVRSWVCQGSSVETWRAGRGGVAKRRGQHHCQVWRWYCTSIRSLNRTTWKWTGNTYMYSEGNTRPLSVSSLHPLFRCHCLSLSSVLFFFFLTRISRSFWSAGHGGPCQSTAWLHIPGWLILSGPLWNRQGTKRRVGAWTPQRWWGWRTPWSRPPRS